MSVSVVLSILLETYYGDKIYGDYVLSFSSIELLGVFSLIGFNQFFLVHIPKLYRDPETISFIYTRARRNVLLSSVILSFLMFGFTFLDVDLFRSDNTRFFFRIGALSIPVFAMSTLATSLLNSLKKIVISQLTDRVIRPLLVLIGIASLIYFDFSPSNIIYTYIVAVILGLGFDYYQKAKHFTLVKNPSSDFSISQRRRSLVYIVVINFTTLVAVKLDTYMLGWMSGTEYSGVYNVYIKLSSFVSLGLSSIVVAIVPYISEQIKNKQLKRARNYLKLASRLSLLIGTIAFVGIYFISPYFFDIYKSSLFEENVIGLYIICGASFANLLSGPSGAVLLASDNLKILTSVQVSATVINVLLNVIMIPLYGLTGAALATLASQIYSNSLLYYFSIRLVKLNPTAFGK